MTPFDRLERMASRSVDWLNAQPFVLTPMKRPPNGRPVVDENRPIIEGRGVFDLRKGNSSLQLGDRKSGAGNDFRMLVGDDVPTLSIDRRAFDDIDGDPIEDSLVRQDDNIEIDGRTYQVVSAQADGHSRITCKLTKGGARAAG